MQPPAGVAGSGAAAYVRRARPRTPDGDVPSGGRGLSGLPAYTEERDRGWPSISRSPRSSRRSRRSRATSRRRCSPRSRRRSTPSPTRSRAGSWPSRPTRRPASAASRSRCCPRSTAAAGCRTSTSSSPPRRSRPSIPGFGTAVLVNGLGLMPVWYYGTEEQKQRFIGGATADTSNEFIVGYAASEPPGSPGGTANFDAPAIGGAGMGVTATLDGDEYVLNGRKYWPCNVGGWDNQGANLNLVVVRHRPGPRRHRGHCRRSSSSAARRASPTTTSARWASARRRTSRSSSTTRGCPPTT